MAKNLAEQAIKELRPFASSLDVYIEFQQGDPESWSYANDIAAVFRAAGTTTIGGRPNSFPFEAIFGAILWVNPDTANPSLISNIFAKAQISPLRLAGWDRLWMAPKRPIPNVRIFVGPKPPPAIMEWFAMQASSDATTDSAARE